MKVEPLCLACQRTLGADVALARLYPEVVMMRRMTLGAAGRGFTEGEQREERRA